MDRAYYQSIDGNKTLFQIPILQYGVHRKAANKKVLCKIGTTKRSVPERRGFHLKSNLQVLLQKVGMLRISTPKGTAYGYDNEDGTIRRMQNIK